MGKKRILWASCALIAITTVVVAVALKTNTSLEQSPSNVRAVKNNGDSIIRPLQDARVVAFTKWSVDDSENAGLSCIVRAFDQDPNYDGAGVKLSIFDQAGAVIYQDYFSEVQSIYSSYALRKSSPQLIVEASYEGSTSFLKMLDYQNGKVVDLMEAVKPNNDFTVNAEVRPQLRTGVNPAVEPYQVLLTEGVGLASPAEKYTNVFRYKDGAYRYVGKFSTKDVDDYMEKLLARSITSTK